MHEMVLVHKALDTILEECEGKDVVAIRTVYLTVGDATDVLQDLIDDMFKFLARGTIAEHANVIVQRTPLTVRCNKCGEVFPIEVRNEESWHCPCCGAYHDYRLVSGREFCIDRIEVECSSSGTDASCSKSDNGKVA